MLKEAEEKILLQVFSKDKMILYANQMRRFLVKSSFLLLKSKPGIGDFQLEPGKSSGFLKKLKRSYKAFRVSQACHQHLPLFVLTFFHDWF